MILVNVIYLLNVLSVLCTHLKTSKQRAVESNGNMLDYWNNKTYFLCYGRISITTKIIQQ